jgi:Protein of unknown function (DUF3108)
MSTPSADLPNPANELPPAESGRFALARTLAKRQGLFSTTKRKLVAALLASLVLHLIFGAFIEAEPPEEAVIPLKAQFMKLPPPPTAQTSVAQAKSKPKPRPKPQPNAAVAALPATEPRIAQSESVVEKAPEPKGESGPEPKNEEPVAEKTAEAAPEKKEEVPPVTTIDPSKLPPRKIQLGYTVFLGENKSELGPVQLIFTHDNGRYKMRVTGRVRGLAAVFYPGIYQGESEGVITDEGLRPDKFIEERGSPDKRREAIFDHANKKVTTPDKEPLVIDGIAHDPLTWIVQFYFSMPKTERATFSVASTRRIDTYTMERTGKDNIATPVGNVDVQIWRGSRKPRADGSGTGGSAQFWLAPEYHFVPFQIQLVSASGRSAYLELTAINTE